MSDAFDRARLSLSKATDAFEEGTVQAHEYFDGAIKIAQTEALLDIAESLRDIHSLINKRSI